MTAAVVKPLEGLPPRRASTVDEVLRMQEAGIIGEDENFELIEGEIVAMQAKNSLHERIKLALIRALARAVPDHLQLGVETTLYLSNRTFLEPDLTLFPMMDTEAVRGPDILLAIEVADTSLAYDRGLKAQLYAKYGVRKLWVIDAKACQTFIHRDPSEKGWGSIVVKIAQDRLTSDVVPNFSIKLSEI